MTASLLGFKATVSAAVVVTKSCVVVFIPLPFVGGTVWWSLTGQEVFWRSSLKVGLRDCEACFADLFAVSPAALCGSCFPYITALYLHEANQSQKKKQKNWFSWYSSLEKVCFAKVGEWCLLVIAQPSAFSWPSVICPSISGVLFRKLFFFSLLGKL